MASEVADLAPPSLPSAESTLPVREDVLMTNGDHAPVTHNEVNSSANAFETNSIVSRNSAPLGTSEKPSATATAAGPTPIEDVAPGIQPVSDFIPKEALTSHPTPPPDEPLEPASVDVHMADSVDAPASTPPQPGVTAAPVSEPSLVRQREDDADDKDDEPVAKRSKVDNEVPGLQDADMSSTLSAPVPTTVDDASFAAVDAPIEDSMAELSTAVTESEAIKAEEPQAAVEPSAVEESAVPAESAVVAETPPTETKPVEDIKPVAESVVSRPAAPETAASTTSSSSRPAYSTEPMTSVQTKSLQEKLKNLKKTKHALSFLNPVDHVALNIPTYPEIVKNPMDISTMEGKLKVGQYSSVQAFADDFELIITNTRTFNGDAHVVTQAGMNMQAYFRKTMENVPGPDQAAPQKLPKRASPPAPKLPSAGPARRESRSANAPAPPPAPTTSVARGPSSNNADTFALQPDGTPQIRRDSSINRPSRTIKPPANRELTYAKPKRKEHQLELKFCQWALDQIRGPEYSHLSSVFQAPVDPVALNIPHYRQIIKHPMDLSTMSQKLKNGEYGKASEFKKDFDLMVDNCLKFNPAGNPVRDLGLGMRRAFDSLWADKESWESTQKGESQRATSGSGDEDSEEEDDDDDEDDEKAATIRALQKQLSELQNTMKDVLGMGQPSKGKKKGKPGVKSTTKKSNAMAAPAKSKPAPAKPKPAKKPKQVTYEEKQEISEAVGKMSEKQIAAITEIITTNCSKFANQDEMELEIDDLPSNVQVMLLEYVRREFGNPHRHRARAASPDDMAAQDDDDFEPAAGDRRRSGGGGKRKKHKPMGKKEQQDKISTIQKQLAQFSNPGMSGSESPTNSSFAAANHNADTSGDESDESEEE